MATTRRLIVLLAALSFVLTVPALASDKAAAQKQKPASGTRTASCIVKVTADPAVLPVNFDTIEYIMRSSGVAIKAAREVLALSPDRINQLLPPERPDDETTDAWRLLRIEPLSDDVSALPMGIPRAPVEHSAPPAIRPERGMEVPQVEPKLEEIPSTDATGVDPYTFSARLNPPVRPVPRRPVPTRAPAPSPSTPGPYGATITGPLSAQQTVIFRLMVQLPDNCPNPKAEEFAKAVIGNLEQALMSAFDEHRGMLRNQADGAREEVARCENELRNLQAELRRVSGSRSLDRFDLLRRIDILREQIQGIEMNKAESSAYANSIGNQISEQQFRLKEQLQADEVAKELEGIVRTNAESLSKMEDLAKAGRAAVAELADLQEKLARAKIDLAKRREELGKSKSGTIESLTKRLSDFTTESSRNDARIQTLRRQFEETTQLLERADDYEIFSLKADATRQNLRELMVLSDQLELRMRLTRPPWVSRIGAD